MENIFIEITGNGKPQVTWDSSIWFIYNQALSDDDINKILETIDTVKNGLKLILKDRSTYPKSFPEKLIPLCIQ